MTGDRVRIATEDDIEEGGRLLADIEGTEIAVFNVDGDYHAVLNFCIHQGGPLCEGDVFEGQLEGADLEAGEDHAFWRYDPDRRSVTCPWHGWKFDIETGVNVNDDRYTVPTYDIVVEDGDLYVEI